MDKRTRAFNFILSSSVVLFVVIILGLKFDYYYDLNDDVLMKDILSGAYSGECVSRNIQMLYPISLLFSVLYRILPGVAWYGYALCIFQFGALLIIVNRSLSFLDGYILKIATAVSEIAIFIALMLNHLINVQYTITVAFMAAAAAMWFITLKIDGSIVEVILRALPAILILVVAFLLRSEMLMLMLPFVLAAIVYTFFNREVSKDRIYKVLSIFAAIILPMILGLGINKLAYSDDEWREFSSLFDARTNLYDYQIIPEYEGNEAFYDSIGLNREEAYLFENYNYGLNDKVDSVLMGKVASYAKEVKDSDEAFGSKLIRKMRIYIYEISHGKNSTGSDYPYNLVAGILYIMIIAMAVGSRKLIDLWCPTTLFLGRTLIWMYILMGDRSPDRITHSLYFVEIVVLFGLLYKGISERKNVERAKILEPMLITLLFIIMAAFIAPDRFYSLNVDQVKREETNTSFLKLYEYTMQHPDDLYLFDVYSSVAYSEKMFDKSKEISKENTELMGGWFYGSPIEKAKILKVSDGGMEEALLNDNVYIISKVDTDMQWLSDYYKSHGENAEISLMDSIASEFIIYELHR